MKKISDLDVSRIIGIPNTTIQDWKKRDDYRKIIYDFLKSFTKEELQDKKNYLISKEMAQQ